jgi:benzodiazapine receptor
MKTPAHNRPRLFSLQSTGLGLIAFILLCQLVGGLGSLATVPNIPTWYAGLEKPPWNPPNWVFGPMWTTLYLLMAVSAWLVWRDTGKRWFSKSLLPFWLQLVANGIWSPLFFCLHQTFLGLVDIVLLWGLILWTLITFFHIRRLAAWLLLPYLLWVTYATTLNFFIWEKN